MLADFYCSLFGKIDNGRKILTVLPQGEILRFDRRFIHIGDSLRVVFLAHSAVITFKQKGRVMTCRVSPSRCLTITTLNNALRSIVFASTLVERQHDAWIDPDPILVFLCVGFLHLIVDNPRLS